MTVSVIVPYIETTDHILKTADSIKNQKKIRQGDVDLLVVDITPDQTASQKLSGYSYAKVISAPEAENEAQAYNLALKELTADYAIFARPGDVFGSHYFMNALNAVGEKKPYAFAVPIRFCINPVYSKYKYINRTNILPKYEDSVVDIRDNPSFLQPDIDGCIIMSSVLKNYPADDSLRFEYFHDVMLRLQKDNPSYYAMGKANFNTFMPLSDDSAYFVPSNHIEWYRDSVEKFLLPLAEREKDKDGKLPYYIQYYLMYAVSARFLANMNNRNKRNMDEEELQAFFDSCKKVLNLLDDTIVLNAGKCAELALNNYAVSVSVLNYHLCKRNVLLIGKR